MCEVLQHSWYLEDLWYIRTQSNRLLKHSILMVWRIETMRGVLGTVGSMFSQICHFNVKNLEFFLKILYPHCFFYFILGPHMYVYAIQHWWCLFRCVIAQPLMHSHTVKDTGFIREDMTLMFSKRNFTFLTTEKFSNFSGIISLSCSCMT